MQSLTTKQKAFCGEFVKDENRRQAAIRAGYGPKAASQQAAKLLADERIQARIAKLREAEAPPDEMTLEGHLRVLERLRDKLIAAANNPEITAPQIRALRLAVDAEVARWRAVKLLGPDPRTPKEDDALTMGELLRDTLRPGSRKPEAPRSNGSGDDG